MSDLIERLSNPVFSRIRSIGYEFEAHNLAKLVSFDKKYFASKTTSRSQGTWSRSKNSTKYSNDDYVETVCQQPDRKDYEFCTYADDPSETHAQLKSMCDTVEMASKDNYWHVVQKGNSIPIVFQDNHSCHYFPDVEWNITFFTFPEATPVISTFQKAVDLILDQLLKEKYQYVKLVANNDKVSEVVNTRLWNGAFLEVDEHPFHMIPQMTFCVHASHCIDVIEGLLFPSKHMDKIAELIKFVRTTPFDPVQQNYLFFVVYMVKKYIEYKKQKGKIRVYKFLTAFLPRHSISKLYKKLKIGSFFQEYTGTILKQGELDFLRDLSSDSEELVEMSELHEEKSNMFPLENDMVFIEFRQFPQFLRHFLGHTSMSVGLIELQDGLHEDRKRDISGLKTRRLKMGFHSKTKAKAKAKAKSSAS